MKLMEKNNSKPKAPFIWEIGKGIMLKALINAHFTDIADCIKSQNMCKI